MLLLVEAENTPAMALYKKMGYKEVFRDSDVKASKAVAYSGGSTALQTVKVSPHLSLLSFSASLISLAHTQTDIDILVDDFLEFSKALRA